MSPRWGLGIAACIVLWCAYSLGRRAGRAEAERGNEPENVFVLAVGLKFKSTEDRDALLQTWRKLAAHTREHEPDALSYKWLVADNDPTRVLVFERYTHREAYTGPHRQSASFFAFKDAQKQFQIEISGQSYYETPHGFMWRA